MNAQHSVKKIAWFLHMR